MSPRVRRALCLTALILVGACSIERAPAGRPGAAIVLPADSAASPEVYAALRLYYTRVTARDWAALATSFWPRASITAIMGAGGGTPAGPSEPGQVETIAIEQAIKRAAAMHDCPVRHSTEMIRANVVTYGPLADAWVVYRYECGVTRDSSTTHLGVDAFHLMKHGGEWRIAGLTFTHEIADAPLSRP